MANWMNLGDMDPERGTLLVDIDTLRLDEGRGVVRASCVSVVPESSIRGSGHIFMLGKGGIAIDGFSAISALETIGARIEGSSIVRPGHDGEDVRVGIRSLDGLLTLIEAAHAWGGLSSADFSTLVSTDLPRPEDPDIIGFGEPDAWYVGAPSFWAIMRDAIPGFDHAPEENPGSASRLDLSEDLSGLSRGIRNRSDLMKIWGFRDLDTDTDGNPCVWENRYCHRDEETGREIASWIDTWSCQCDDECPVTGRDISPSESVWIGPSDRALVELWDRMPEAGTTPELRSDGPSM